MKIALIRNKKQKCFIFILLTAMFVNAQKIEIYNKDLKSKIILHQKLDNDSVYLYIDKKENKWLEKTLNIKTVNYWIGAPIEVSLICCQKNTIIIKRTFSGNSIVGDKLYFKKCKNKYFFKSLKEFEQKIR